MIVGDTNVVASLLLPGPVTTLVDDLLIQQQPKWAAPRDTWIENKNHWLNQINLSSELQEDMLCIILGRARTHRYSQKRSIIQIWSKPLTMFEWGYWWEGWQGCSIFIDKRRSIC